MATPQTLTTHVHTINPFPSDFLQPPFIVCILDAWIYYAPSSLTKECILFCSPPTPGSCDASKVSLEFTICCLSPTHTLWLIKSFTCLFLGSEKVPSQYVCHEYMRALQLQRDGILGGVISLCRRRAALIGSCFSLAIQTLKSYFLLYFWRGRRKGERENVFAHM